MVSRGVDGRWFGPGGAIAAAVFVASVAVASRAAAGECDSPEPGWIACEDFEAGHLGWESWFAESPFVQCDGCPNGANDPARIRLTNEQGAAHEGEWALHMPGEASAQYRGGSLAVRTCDGEKQPGCALTNHEQLYFRTWVKLAEDHEYVHHFLAVSGSRPDAFWETDGNAGCRPNGERWAGTTVDFNKSHEAFFYTYHPQMSCDAGGYCSGDYAQSICDGCADKDMGCSNGLECCWGNHFEPAPAVVLPKGKWVCLEMFMRLNTPAMADGKMAFWVDDQLGHEVEGMQWRDVQDLGLNKAFLQHYIEAGDTNVSNRVWFDNVVVSTERIGCGVDEPAPETTSSSSGGTDDPTTSGASSGGTGTGGSSGGGETGGPTTGGAATGGGPTEGTVTGGAATGGAATGGAATGGAATGGAGESTDSGGGCACSAASEPQDGRAALGVLLALAGVLTRRRRR